MTKKEFEPMPGKKESTLPEVNDFVVEFRKYTTGLTKKFLARKPWEPKDENKVLAFIPGTIQKVFVKEGDLVNEGDPLLILEAMKMKNTIFAPGNAKISKIHVAGGQSVAKNKILIEFEAD